MLESRAQDGAFESLFDFCRRVDLTAVNRRVIESLIKCGAFDSTGISRARMTAALDDAIRAGQAHQRDQASNQIDIFALLGSPSKSGKKMSDMYAQAIEWSQAEALAFEKESLGFYISGHPLDKHERAIKRLVNGTIAALKEKPSAGDIKVVGVVSALKLKNTKKGDRYGSFNLEDKTGFIEVIAWPDVYVRSAELLGKDDPIFVKGRLDVGEERVQVFANEIISLVDAAAKFKANGNGSTVNGDKVDLYVREASVSADELVRLRDMLLDFPGRATVYLHLLSENERETVIELPDQVRVTATSDLENAVAQLFESRVSFHSFPV